ncbi:c-type cytochrome [Stagnimonas aquatica]|nr:c-type cytochrome [Stagnimonas aquatica]
MSSNHSHHDDKAHDQAFFRTFGMVLAALFGIFGFCIFAASLIVPKAGPSEAEAARLEARIKPLATVVTDPAALLKTSAPAVKREPLTADQVFAQACSACHNAGVLGAPKVGDKADWSKRLAAEGGFDGVVAKAISGKNQMPPRGGNPDLTDDEIKITVKLMLEKSGL